VFILTYNLFIRPPGIKSNSDDYKDERIEEFIAVMNQFDIIGIQEIFSRWSWRQNYIIERAYEKGFYYHAASVPHPVFSTFLLDGGLLLLSKYPIVENDGIIFPQGVHSDGLCSKGVVYAKIQITNSRNAYIHVFLTHTQASYGTKQSLTVPPGASFMSNLPMALSGNQTNLHGNACPSEVMRTKQLQQLKEFIELKAGHDQQPIFILGDLNVNGRKYEESTEDSEPYKKMISILSSPAYHIRDVLKESFGGQPVTFADVREEQGGKLVARETQLTDHSELYTRQRLDYIFFADKAPTRLSVTTTSTGGRMVLIDEEERHTHSFKIKDNSTMVQPFFVERRPFSQLSDHYGVSTVLIYNHSKYPTSQ